MIGKPFSLKVDKKLFLDGLQIITQLVLKQINLKGAQLLSDLTICGLSILILRKDLGVGGKSVRRLDRKVRICLPPSKKSKPVLTQIK